MRFFTVLAFLCSILLCSTLRAAPEQARPADSFVDSVGVNPSLAADLSNAPIIQQKLEDIGIRHIRWSESSDKSIAFMQGLARHGIKTMLLEDSNFGVVPDSSFFLRVPTYDGSPHGYTLHDFVKKVGPGTVIDSVEMPNEIDAGYSQRQQFWHPSDFPHTPLSADPQSPTYWVKYITAETQASWRALKSDPKTAMVKIIGPALGQTYAGNTVPNPLPPNSLAPFVDYGAFHPYPGGGNFDTDRSSYATVDWYLGKSNFPSVNMDTDDGVDHGVAHYDFVFLNYQPPFGDKPMVATETGYSTRPMADYTTFNRDTSEADQAKYLPRLLCEYFAHGVVRTFLFNFVDDGDGTFGLMHKDYSPKPAYAAVKTLLHTLSDPGPKFRPGTLNYTLLVKPVRNWKDSNTGRVSDYDRTQYLHHLLLQKRDGAFYLLLWHETTSQQINDQRPAGKLVPGHDVTPPALPVVLTLPSGITHVACIVPNHGAGMTILPVVNHHLSLNIPDQVVILRLPPRKRR